MDINNEKVAQECIDMIKSNGIEGVNDASNYVSSLYCSGEVNYETFSILSHYIDSEKEKIM